MFARLIVGPGSVAQAALGERPRGKLNPIASNNLDKDR